MKTVIIIYGSVKFGECVESLYENGFRPTRVAVYKTYVKQVDSNRNDVWCLKWKEMGTSQKTERTLGEQYVEYNLGTERLLFD